MSKTQNGGADVCEHERPNEDGVKDLYQDGKVFFRCRDCGKLVIQTPS